MLLQHLEKTAQQAHNGTSFSPEKRGTALIQEHSEELQADMDELTAQGVPAEAIADYKARYEHHLTSWLYAKGRCISSMIAGPSKFPVRRAQKANRSEDRHWEIFRTWRAKAKKAIVRRMQPEKTFRTEIERYQDKLQGLQKLQNIYKKTNAIIRKTKGKDCTAELVAIGLSEQAAQKAQERDWCGRIGFPPYVLQNNNANIKRTQERIAELSKKEEIRTNNGEQEYPFEGGVVVVNYEADRVQIKHETKPPYDVIQQLKRKGFRWSPSNMAWQRQITTFAIYDAREITKTEIPIN